MAEFEELPNARHAVPAEVVNGAGGGLEVALTKDQIRELPADAGE